LRAGALVLSDWLKTRATAVPLLLWQPVISGRQHLNQFLRLRGVSKMLEDSDARSETASIRADLKAGRSVEVAGYALSPRLASAMELSNADFSVEHCAQLAVFEVGAADRQEVSPALASAVSRWQGGGVAVVAEVLEGPSFWQAQEIETCPLLIDRSVAALRGFAR
jgi:uncharacterized protein